MKLKIKVHANSSQEKLNKISDCEYEIWINEKPVEGKANEYIEKFLKRELKLKGSVKIVKGLRSKNKSVEIFD